MKWESECGHIELHIPGICLNIPLLLLTQCARVCIGYKCPVLPI